MFRKFLNAIRVYKSDISIIGGDVSGKVIVPLVRDGNMLRGNYKGQDLLLRAEDAGAVISDIENRGRYVMLTEDPSEGMRISSDKEYFEGMYRKLAAERLRSWVELADSVFKDSTKIYMGIGNDDPRELSEAVSGDAIVYSEEKVLELGGGLELLTLGYSNKTPWNLPGDLSEEELDQKISVLVSRVSDMNSAIFNLHVPPYDTTLDIAPKLDKNLKPVVGPTGMETDHVGSIAVRNAITRCQPLLGLHGHIHESRGSQKIGRTICLNPGSEYDTGILKAAIVNIDQKKVKSHILIAG